MRLQGKTAIITGAAGGIGAAIAAAYVREGARVAIADISHEAARQTAANLGPQAMAVHLDVTSATSRQATIEACLGSWGGIDILVNNAAIFDMGPLLDISEKSYDRIFSVNVKGLLFMLQDCAKAMVIRGKGGKIINLASQAGRRGEALVATYCASVRAGGAANGNSSTGGAAAGADGGVEAGCGCAVRVVRDALLRCAVQAGDAAGAGAAQGDAIADGARQQIDRVASPYG